MPAAATIMLSAGDFMPDTASRSARQRGLDFLEQQKAARGNQLSDDEAMALALEAQRAARRHAKLTQHLG